MSMPPRRGELEGARGGEKGGAGRQRSRSRGPTRRGSASPAAGAREEYVSCFIGFEPCRVIRVPPQRGGITGRDLADVLQHQHGIPANMILRVRAVRPAVDHYPPEQLDRGRRAGGRQHTSALPSQGPSWARPGRPFGRRPRRLARRPRAWRAPARSAWAERFYESGARQRGGRPEPERQREEPRYV